MCVALHIAGSEPGIQGLEHMRPGDMGATINRRTQPLAWQSLPSINTGWINFPWGGDNCPHIGWDLCLQLLLSLPSTLPLSPSPRISRHCVCRMQGKDEIRSCQVNMKKNKTCLCTPEDLADTFWLEGHPTLTILPPGLPAHRSEASVETYL